MKTDINSKIVLRWGKFYLENYYEDWNDEANNFNVTEDIERAYSFYGNDDIPKYAWNYKEERNFNTVDELCELLGGSLERVTVAKTTKYHTEKFSFDETEGENK